MGGKVEKEWLKIVKDIDKELFPGKTAQKKLEMLLSDKDIDAKLIEYFSKRVNEWLNK